MSSQKGDRPYILLHKRYLTYVLDTTTSLSLSKLPCFQLIYGDLFGVFIESPSPAETGNKDQQPDNSRSLSNQPHPSFLNDSFPRPQLIVWSHDPTNSKFRALFSFQFFCSFFLFFSKQRTLASSESHLPLSCSKYSANTYPKQTNPTWNFGRCPGRPPFQIHLHFHC